MLDDNYLKNVVLDSGLGIQVDNIGKITTPTTNHVFKVESGSECFILKRFMNHQRFPVNRKQQYDLQKIGFKLGLATKPLWLSADGIWMLESFEDSCQTEPSIRRLAEVLAEFHSHTAPSFLLNIVDKWQGYCASLPKSHEMNQRVPSYAEEWELFQRENGFDFVLCHNDLQFAHLSDTKNVCFDWEYAGHHCRFFDLSSCIKINGLSSDQQAKLLSSYSELAGIPLQQLVSFIDKAHRFVTFTYDLWAAVAELPNDPPVDM